MNRSWNNEITVGDNLESFQETITKWNKQLYRNIFVRKRKLISELERVQKVLDVCFSQTLHRREYGLQHEIEEVLAHEELLWFQKSKAKWLHNGDRNTSYFHSCTLTRRKRNKIKGLIVDNEWCLEDDVLKQYVVSFFKEVYTMVYLVSSIFPCRGKFLVLSCDETYILLSMVSDEEVRRAVFTMDPLKALGVDGF